METNRSFVVFTAVGPDRPGLVNQISSLIHEAGANIEDNRMAMRLLAPQRGRILDRYGVPLALNRQNYRLVIKERKAVYDFDHTPTEGGREIEKETVLLPLSADGATVDHVLIYLETGKRRVWW